MTMRNQHYRGRFGAQKRIVKITPQADASLKKVFSSIGVPGKRPFKPDSFQLEALEVLQTDDCLVTAPTGAGKTWIAEQAIDRFHRKGGRSWYASPLKALSNSKYIEFSRIFGPRNVGILTGDRKENADAPIVVGTTEILRNQLYDAMHEGKTLNTDFVVLDEAHFLGDPERGVVWEEIMIYLPGRIPLLLLSATIGNARQIAQWLGAIRSRPCRVVEESRRPVPLFPLFFHPTGKLYPLLNPEGPRRIFKNVRSFINSQSPPVLAPARKLPPFADILRVLRKYRLLPAIFFLKSRADCDAALERCMDNLIEDSDRKMHLNQRISEIIADHPHMSAHRQRWHLEHLAVGAHHSGQLPSWKMVLEQLLTEGLLDAVFATSTVAAGVNFPARTVVFLNSDRYNGVEFLPLTATELHQMTGRAGRRGMDRIGFAMAIPGPFMDLRLIARLMVSPPSDVLSQIRMNFSMVLNLLLSHGPDQIEELLDKSFAAFQMFQGKKRLTTDVETVPKALWLDFLRHLDFLKETGFVQPDGALTEDGLWAARLRVDQPVLIAEGFRRKLFPESDSALMAGVVAAFVNEKSTDEGADPSFVPKALLRVFLNIKKGLKPFAENMSRHGFEVRQLFFRPAAAVYAWAFGWPWEDVVRISEMAEGDLAMLILRTADNLRHVRALSEAFPEAAQTAGEAIDRILRDPVLMEYSG
ncbi:MAG: DEAD/DEAH box helicase [Desulfobacterales bacterium]|nr:DEAD/DEAH box helicase [Desulfobacterales bacterium]